MSAIAELVQKKHVALRAMMRGSVLCPGDAGYTQARSPWNLAVEQYPSVVAMVDNDADVVAAVNFAREQGLGIGVQSTGHGVVIPCDGGLLINTACMKGVEIDPAARTARVRAGVVWREVIEEAQRFGLAPLSGSSPDVGVAGYTLGGGVGWMARRYGYAADSLGSVDIVTADGHLRHASETCNSDLFWALRGGSGNFGVVTTFEFSLYPVTQIYGGGIFYAIEQAHDVLRLYGEWVKGVPETLTSRIAMINVPPLPFIPAAIRGRWVIAVQACLLGTEEEGAGWFRPFRQLAPPLLDTMALIPYTAIGSIANDPKEPLPILVGTELLREISPEVIEQVLRVVGATERSSLKIVEIRHLGGAIARRAEGSSPVGHRGAGFWMNAIAGFERPEEQNGAADEVAIVQDAVRPWTTGGVLLNGLAPRSQRLRSAYAPENYRRLVSLKRKYDPGNLFRYNHNIPPAAE